MCRRYSSEQLAVRARSAVSVLHESCRDDARWCSARESVTALRTEPSAWCVAPQRGVGATLPGFMPRPRCTGVSRGGAEVRGSAEKLLVWVEPALMRTAPLHPRRQSL